MDYKCVCGKTFETAQKFAGHTTWCVKYLKFKFPELTDDEIHLKMYDRNYEVIDRCCPYCNKHFTSKLSYNMHERVCKLNPDRKVCLCNVCGNEFSPSNIERHTLSCANNKQNKKAYMLDHDDLFCKFCGKECKNKNSLVQHEIRCKNNPNKIKTTIYKFNNKGRRPWNKGLTKKTDERVLKQVYTYKKNKLKQLHKDTCGDNNPARRMDVRKKISEVCLEKSRKGEWHTSLAKNMHYFYKGEDLHGTWELMFAIFLDVNDIKWKRNKERFEYIFRDKTHYYTPDFYLIDTDEYIEIKGYISPDGRDYAKWNCFPKDKKLKVLKYKELLELGVFNMNIEKYTRHKN